MKLRIRCFETKQTLRIEVPNPCSLKQLKNIIAQSAPVPPPSSSSDSLFLSLNAKDELQSSSPRDDTLHSIGITSGDLIFFTFNPSAFSSPNRTPLPPDNLPSRPTLESQPSQPTLDSQPSQPTLESQPSQPTLESQPSQPTLESQPSQPTTPLTEADPEPHSEPVKYNTQREDAMQVEEDDQDYGEGSRVEGTGKSFSVPGFLRKVFTEELRDNGDRHHKLLVIAVHAVLLESGFVGFDPILRAESGGFQFRNEWPSAAFRMSLFYTLPEVIRCSRDRNNGIDGVVLKFQSVGNFVSVYGSMTNNGSTTHCVRLNEDELVPFLNVVWANCGLAEEITGKDGFLGTSPEREVFKFWRAVKDKLALPLLIDLCEKAGLELPPCFMRLPTDIILKILNSLPGVDIAKMSCLCSELRYLASSDDLWKQRFVEHFGDAARSVGGGHWKDEFARMWDRRKRRKSVARDKTPLMPMIIRDPHPFGLPWRPRIIGGDHDVSPLPEGYFLHPISGIQPARLSRQLPSHVPRCNLGGFGNSNFT